MQNERILIDNLKCGGCSATILTSILTLQELDDVEVNAKGGLVEVFHYKAIHLSDIKSRLKSLVYAEKVSAEGFEKMTENPKSNVSYTVGCLNVEEQYREVFDKSQHHN